MYAVAKNDRLKTSDAVTTFQGGSSDATWRVTLDFQALGIPAIRQMWLTFAPPLASGSAFPDTEWEATFTNWTLTGPDAKRALSVAGPGSVRIEENDSWCRYSGDWEAGRLLSEAMPRGRLRRASVGVLRCPLSTIYI
jgi:hypothetical protein